MVLVYGLLGLIVVLFVLIVYMWRVAKQDRLITQDLYFSHFPEEFGELRIFFISDIHRRTVSTRLIEDIKGKVDLVIIGGDIREGGVPIERVEKNIVKLKEIGPLYFVWGNNDYEGDVDELTACLIKHGVKILDNTSVSIESDKGERLPLLGIEDISLERDRLDLALEGCGEEPFKILVSHNPLVKNQIKPEDHIHLVLCGHTHGGQIRLLGFGPYRLGGITQEGDCLYITSNGYGTSTLPLRLEAKPETHLFTLKKGESTVIGEAFVKVY